MIKQCFESYFQLYPIDRLVCSRPLPVNIRMSSKYKQIMTSVSEIGLIEPVVIFIEDDVHKILDGHLRIEVLKDLNITHAHCLVSPVNEAYTYNKRVNRLTILQEQKMLRKAVESGVSTDKLCAVLGVSPGIINTRLHISDGIAKEVIALLAEKNVSQNIFDILRKMKHYKQTECVRTMISLNNFTKKFALSLLHSMSPEHLVTKNKDESNKDLIKTLARLEKEMAALQVETQNIQHEYAENNIRLIIVKSYIIKLFRNSEIMHWLYDYNIEFFDLLKKVSGIDDLNNITSSSGL
ncbi:MAG: RepB plasmid partitioning protein [Citrobacter amalonaticus]|nr:RepB plasmid partitioning protein [Citrobacter amalonaticus]